MLSKILPVQLSTTVRSSRGVGLRYMDKNSHNAQRILSFRRSCVGLFAGVLLFLR